MKYTTSLRPWVSRRLEKIGSADLLVGIPCYNNQSTIEHVVKSVSDGLHMNYPDMRSLIVVSDGGSTDDTRDIAQTLSVYPYIEKIVQIYRGDPGKGSALRAIFEAASFLEVKACVVVDSDLRSISPAWVRSLIQPILERNFHFVAPLYTRYKYDGTITNTIVYNLTRALFGKRIRQPIGGDFGFSLDLARFYATTGEWDSDISRFGIDIWMTLTPIARKLPICQSYLGTKVHDVKDPGESLGPMFRQVIFTLFLLMDRYYEFWSTIGESEPVPSFGDPGCAEPDPFAIDTSRMIGIYRDGFEHFGVFWQKVLRPENYELLRQLHGLGDDDFYLSTEAWAKIVYDFSATFHAWERHRRQLVDTMSPLYYARVASFVTKTRDMSNQEAENVVEDQARQFEALKPYLLESWSSRSQVSLERSV
jgi:glycosyltransferase involved in cell wall biosynthesis